MTAKIMEDHYTGDAHDDAGVIDNFRAAIMARAIGLHKPVEFPDTGESIDTIRRETAVDYKLEDVVFRLRGEDPGSPEETTTLVVSESEVEIGTGMPVELDASEYDIDEHTIIPKDFLSILVYDESGRPVIPEGVDRRDINRVKGVLKILDELLEELVHGRPEEQ